MNCKIRPFCQQPSYSAATFGKWICPHCNEDLTLVKFSPIRNDKDSTLEKQKTRKTNDH